MRKIRESIFLKLLLVFIIASGVAFGVLEMAEDLFSVTPQRDVMWSILVIFILFLTYLCIRFILSPLKVIEKGVREVSSGNLSFEIEAKTNDELGRIVRSFNEMAAQVRSMIRARDQLLLDVSHEFRSPLTRIKLALEVPSDERESIKQSIAEIELMVSEILESARLESGQGSLQLEEVNVASLLREIAGKYQNVKPGVNLKDSNEEVTVSLDVVRFRLAVQNLLDNALKYSAHQERPVLLGWERVSEQELKIWIQDFGIGIPNKDLAFIFEPFYRVDRSRSKDTGGYGLGLALTKKIVSAHRGSIDVESEPGHGTLFTVRLLI